MKAKIEWYQEVLELEPGSKVFFPLARLLGQTGQADEAIRVLRQGLARHPEYIEARLLLVQLLQESGDSGQCSNELNEITDIFSSYPGFWTAWSERAANESVACALSFLSLVFRFPDLSLREVFASSLRGLTGAEPAPLPAPPLPRDAPWPVAEPVEPVAAVSELATLTAALRLPPHEADEADAARDTPAAPRKEESDEPSVRTRSMAEILADQGDLQGAADIYSEILAHTPSGAEADKLRARLADLAARLGPGAESPVAVGAPAVPVVPVSEDDNAEPDAGTESLKTPGAAGVPFPGQTPTPENPMRDMLEKLARRLDARAQA